MVPMPATNGANVRTMTNRARIIVFLHIFIKLFGLINVFLVDKRNTRMIDNLATEIMTINN